jgi:hypothetical protein
MINKMRKSYSVFILLFFLLLFVGSCDNNSSAIKSATTDSVSPKKIPKVKEESIDGIYSYEDNSSKLSITLSGNYWQGKTMIISGFGEGYDSRNAQYENGIARGKELFESSGMVKIGYVSGNNLYTSIGGQSAILTKESKRY